MKFLQVYDRLALPPLDTDICFQAPPSFFFLKLSLGCQLFLCCCISHGKEIRLIIYVFMKYWKIKDSLKRLCDFYFQNLEHFLFFIYLVLLSVYIFHPCNSHFVFVKFILTLLNLICTLNLICVGLIRARVMFSSQRIPLAYLLTHS